MVDPNNAAVQTILFSNPNNDTFVNNDNAIVLYNIDTNYFWYINGAFHGLITVSWSPLQAIEPSKLHLDLNNTLDANGILYDLKLYNQPLFEYPASSAEQQLFNKKRLIDISQFTIITDDADGNFVLKELTPYKTIKANSLKSGSAVTEKSVTTISSRRTIQTVEVNKKVSETEKYQVFDTEVEVNGNLLLENVNQDVGAFFTIYTASQKQTASGVNNFKDTSSIILDDSTNEWIFKREPETANLTTSTTKFKHDTTDLLILKHNEIECGVGLKVGTITFADNSTLTSAPIGFSGNYNDLTNLPNLSGIATNTTNIATNTADLLALNNNISTTHPSWIEFAKNLKLPNGDVISSLYDDTDVRTLLALSAGTNLTWNNTNNQFDVTTVSFSGNYNDLTNKPTLFSENYNDLTNKPTLFSGSYTDLTNQPTLFSGSYTDLTNQPTIPAPYTDADARSSIYPFTTTNSGLTTINGGINVFDTSLWYNTTDDNNRFIFQPDNYTLMKAPDLGNRSIYFSIGTSIKWSVTHNVNTSDNDLSVNGSITSSVDVTTPRMDFTNTTAYITGDKLLLKGIFSSGGTVNLTQNEDFVNSSGATNATMSGFNTNLFINGSLGSANVISGSTAPNNIGQISGIYSTTASGIRTSGTGTGSSGNFNSLTSTGKSKYFLTAGASYRSLRTKNIQSILATCSTISFWYIAGNQGNGGNTPESGESFFIEFLTSTGAPISSATIHTGGTFYSGNAFTFFTHTLTTAQKAGYYVRWIQYNTSTGNYDHYGLADITFNYTGNASPSTTDIDITLENLPTSAPIDSNRLWRDANGFLKIT